ncbi:MAG: alpha-amylase family glycosyl hydrolase, partial [Treponema sp.]|nr:alpha-amylase family glycosyl hydrolase [Treponema sp.]
YDTKDYMAIDPQFGTMADFRDLLRKCHEHGIKLIIDLVMNHTSDQHPWFQEALKEVRAGTPGRYASYYNFYYGAVPPQQETIEYQYDYWGKRYVSARYFRQWGQAAPNVWFEGSFWTGMPDLNFDSAELRQEFEEIVKFWLSAGLDGFRLDATSWPYDYYGLGQMQYGYDGFNVDEKNIELWTWFDKICHRVNNDVYLVGECWKDAGTIANYYRSGMNFFAFQFCDMGTFNWVLDGQNGYQWSNDVVTGWEHTIKARNPDAVSAMFLSNHDKSRTFYNFGGNDINGDARRKMAAALYLMSPGTPFIYYGEEIGLVDFGANNDANGVWADADHRGPMWWSNTSKSGIPSPPDERRTWPVQAPPSGKGVEEQLADPGSLLRFYIKIINLKNRYPWLSYAHNIESVYIKNNGGGEDGRIAAIRVENPARPGQTILLVQNTDQYNTITIELPKPVYRYYCTSVFGNQENIPEDQKDGTVFSGTEFNIYGYSSVVFQEYE